MSIHYEKFSESICNNPDCRELIKICEKCGRPMKKRSGKFGDFWGCSGYGVKDDQCTHTIKISTNNLNFPAFTTRFLTEGVESA